MADLIHLHAPQDASGDAQRLNLFAGRHLGEREFDLRQAYLDARLEPLLAHRQPGVVHGLEVLRDGEQLRVQPGTAVAADGQALRLFFPLDTAWEDVVTTHRARHRLPPGQRLNGYYFLTLARAVYLEEDQTSQAACTRTEPNPLRDSTLETAAYVDLQPITGLPDMSGADQARAANRVCVFHLDHSPFIAGAPSLPVALVRVVNNQLGWLDPVAGRYEARPDGAYRTLLAHYQQQVARITAVDSAAAALRMRRALRLSPGATVAPRIGTLASDIRAARRETDISAGRPTSAAALKTHLGVDYLPAAGPLPDYLVTDIAGGPSTDPADPWRRPRLGFNPHDLQVELVPVRTGDVLPTLRRELGRAPVDLAHATEGRIRVMVAIPDDDFRPDLMDLPAVDDALRAELLERGRDANDDYLYWRYLHDTLYAGVPAVLSSREIAALGLELDDSGELELPAPPRDPHSFYADMIDQRTAQLPEGEKTLPPPYAWGPPAKLPEDFPPPADPDYHPFDGTSLYVQEDLLARRIQWLERELDANDRLLGVFDGFLSLQRQQVDSVTVSLSSLAGGIPGDGSGLKFLKWSPFTTLK